MSHSILTKLRRSISFLAILGVSSVATSHLAYSAEIAAATFTGKLISPGTWQYSLDLTDTGTTTVGTFWFAWIPGDNFMPATPTTITAPVGWTDSVTTGGPSKGSGIRWEASIAADDLTAGHSLAGFSFESTLSPAQLEAESSGSPGYAVDNVVVYAAAPFSDPGFDFQATPAGTGVPEPSSLALGVVGFGALLLGFGIFSRRG